MKEKCEIKKDMSIEVKYSDFTVKYSVVEKKIDDLPRYGIMVECEEDDFEVLENIFFTFDEAKYRCEWLSRNEVFPEGFKDVMADIMV